MRISKTGSLTTAAILFAFAFNSIAAADDAAAPWSVRMADSILAQHPKGKGIEQKDDSRPAAWSYSTALAVYAVDQVGERTKNETYLRYATEYANEFIDASGKIDPKRYKPETFKLDDIAPGRLMLTLYHQTREEKYKNAALELLPQLKEQPRTADGGFWHKKVYEHQMWLDGIYMASPFMADAGVTFDKPELCDEAAKQIETIVLHTHDPKTGLFFHGWDESKSQKWADKNTGLSPNLWGRADGWLAMGIVDVLEKLPPEHPERPKLVSILRDFAAAIAKAQEPTTHVWYQVLDQPQREGNYAESSASCMFVYALAKGVRNHYIDGSYLDVARSGFDGILKQFVETDPATGHLTLKDTCLVAGLGGSPYRDGSYEYYIHEKRGSNDPKGTGPFILASLELESQGSHDGK